MQQVISAQLVAQNGNDFLETSLERSLNKPNFSFLPLFNKTSSSTPK